MIRLRAMLVHEDAPNELRGPSRSRAVSRGCASVRDVAPDFAFGHRSTARPVPTCSRTSIAARRVRRRSASSRRRPTCSCCSRRRPSRRPASSGRRSSGYAARRVAAARRCGRSSWPSRPPRSIVRVVAVRIVDAEPGDGASRPRRCATSPMSRAGWSARSAGSSPPPARRRWAVVTVDYAIPDGDYGLVVRSRSGASDSRRRDDVYGGQGTWRGAIGDRRPQRCSRMVDGDGHRRSAAPRSDSPADARSQRSCSSKNCSTRSRASRSGCPGSSTKCSVSTECAVAWDPVRVALRRVDLDRDEPVAELAAQGLEASRRDGDVVREAEPEHARTLWRALLRPGEVGVADADRGLALASERERQRRLAQHRREHAVVDHHPEREAAGEAHADGADARAAALLRGHRPPSARSHDGDRARAIEREGRRTPWRRSPASSSAARSRRSSAARAAEQRRHPDAEPGVDDPAAEVRDRRGDARASRGSR